MMSSLCSQSAGNPPDTNPTATTPTAVLGTNPQSSSISSSPLSAAPGATPFEQEAETPPTPAPSTKTPNTMEEEGPGKVVTETNRQSPLKPEALSTGNPVNFRGTDVYTRHSTSFANFADDQFGSNLKQDTDAIHK